MSTGNMVTTERRLGIIVVIGHGKGQGVHREYG